ncbi:RNase MRP subunit [Fusarium piperis]|uniref:RNase MRP subunit n=1 Tax=Fusarium piperis TaxID=1435070 RepID=A0A9W8WER4_9HYPO|nr:RNase MRP subunit [Fusarium piperis]
MTSPHPSAALLSTANESLSPVLPILNAFAHRHRNQHHSSHWWSSFSLVRRAARNLSADLTSRPRPIKKKDKPNVEGDHPALARAKWMIRHVVPRTYIAFSQLAADNQHAPLGLLLLSILARINRILSDLVLTDQNPPTTASASTKPTTTDPILSSNSQASTPAGTDGPDIDMGVTISRNEVLPIRKSTTSQLDTKPDSHPTEPPSKERKLKSLTKDIKKSSSKDPAKDKPKKKKKKGGDALSSLFGSL